VVSYTFTDVSEVLAASVIREIITLVIVNLYDTTEHNILEDGYLQTNKQKL
jgi:hypothetical protein